MRAEFCAVLAFAMVCLGFHFLSADHWVPLLDSANLALHEAGHPMVGLFSASASVYGGTLFQLIFPLAAAGHFYRVHHTTGVAVSVIWLGENLLNIARYMADARVQVLPLVGGGEHDWAEIFIRWNVLQLDTRIARFTNVCGVVLILAAVAWLYSRWRESSVA